MYRKSSKLFLIIIGILLIFSFPNQTFAKKKKKLKIYGFIWQTNTTPGIGVQVALFDKKTNKLLAVTKSNFFGKYKFKNLKPGAYIVRVGRNSRDIFLTKHNANEHFHLNTKDGKVDFYAIAQENATVAEVGNSDPALMQWIAGEYYSYQGSTERKLMLCPGGVFYDSKESSYSGNFSNSAGADLGGWGTASANSGSGKWGIQGNKQSGSITFSYKNGQKQTVNFKAIGDNCFLINGIKFCYAGKPRCN
jgi:hypothetical protein